AASKAPWQMARIEFLDGAKPETATALSSLNAQSLALQMAIAQNIPAVCLFSASPEGTLRIAQILNRRRARLTKQTATDSLPIEWGRILMTAILDTFSRVAGKAVVGTEPALTKWSGAQALSEGMRELSDLPERSVLVRIRYLCKKLEADCETLFILRTD